MNCRRRSLAWLLAMATAWIVAGCERKVREPGDSPQDSSSVTLQPLPGPTTKDAGRLQQEALAALQAGDLVRADQLARQALELQPKDPQNIFLVARILGQRNRFDEAIKMLDAMAADDPSTQLPVLGQTAQWMVMQGRWQEAEDRFRRLLELAPQAAVVHRPLAQLLLRQGRRLEAASHLYQLCQLGDIEEAELRTLLQLAFPFAAEPQTEESEPIGPLGEARHLISQDQWSAAIEILTAAVALANESQDAEAIRGLLGRCYAHSEDQQALRAWVDADQSNPPQSDSSPAIEDRTADAWFALGAAAQHRGDDALAVQHLSRSVLRDPTDQHAYRRLAAVLKSLAADDLADVAAARADSLAQTQQLGNEMAGTSARDYEKMTTLITLLDQLQRPLEALAWRAVRAAYGVQKSALSESQAKALLAEIIASRDAVIAAGQATPSPQFILCGIDPVTLSVPADASRGSVTP